MGETDRLRWGIQVFFLGGGERILCNDILGGSAIDWEINSKRGKCCTTSKLRIAVTEVSSDQSASVESDLHKGVAWRCQKRVPIRDKVEFSGFFCELLQFGDRRVEGGGGGFPSTQEPLLATSSPHFNTETS